MAPHRDRDDDSEPLRAASREKKYSNSDVQKSRQNWISTTTTTKKKKNTKRDCDEDNENARKKKRKKKKTRGGRGDDANYHRCSRNRRSSWVLKNEDRVFYRFFCCENRGETEGV